MQKGRGSRCSFSSSGRASWLWESEAAVPRIVRSWELSERVERGCSTINPTALWSRRGMQLRMAPASASELADTAPQSKYEAGWRRSEQKVTGLSAVSHENPTRTKALAHTVDWLDVAELFQFLLQWESLRGGRRSMPSGQKWELASRKCMNCGVIRRER